MTQAPPFPHHRAAVVTEAETRAQRETALVRANLPRVWRFLRRLGLSPEDADDVAQETFVVAVAKLDRIQSGQERSFLLGVAVRIASRARRSRRTREANAVPLHDIDECGSSDLPTDELIARKEARRVLDEILSEMTPPLRTAFVLFELEEMTMVEIAALTETPIGTVASRLRRARDQFQEAARARQARRA